MSRRECRECGKPFTRLFARKNYCSEECVAAKTARDREQRVDAVAADLAAWQQHLEDSAELPGKLDELRAWAEDR